MSVSITSLILDFAFIAILLLSVGYYARKGFFAGIVSFLGTLAAVLVAALVANLAAPKIFDTFFRTGLEERTAQAISDFGVTNLNELLHGLVGFLPDSMIESLSGHYGASLDFGATDIAQQVVGQVVAPMVLPFISILLFFVVFLLLRLLLTILRRVLAGVNYVPLVGTANRLLGGVMGLLVGALYVFLLLCVLWALDATYMAGGLETNWFGSSFAWKLLARFNIFT